MEALARTLGADHRRSLSVHRQSTLLASPGVREGRVSRGRLRDRGQTCERPPWRGAGITGARRGSHRLHVSPWEQPATDGLTWKAGRCHRLAGFQRQVKQNCCRHLLIECLFVAMVTLSFSSIQARGIIYL